MEIKVGIVHGAREIIVETEEAAADVESAFGKAVEDNAVLTLTDDRGRKVLIPASRIAYLELGQEAARRVGFGSL